MPIVIRQSHKDDLDALFPLLLLAEPSVEALRWSLTHLSDSAYRMDEDGQLIGAATVGWKREPSEIVELAIDEHRQGQGLGRRLIEWLILEAKRRGKPEIVVGTSNASIGNIVFYQKCGFRMDHIRKDYFWYYREPIFENGIEVRDMVVFRYELTG